MYGWMWYPTTPGFGVPTEFVDIYVPHTGEYEAVPIQVAYRATTFCLDLASGEGVERDLGQTIRNWDHDDSGVGPELGGVEIVGIDAGEESAAYLYVGLYNPTLEVKWRKLGNTGEILDTKEMGALNMTGPPWLWRSRVHWRTGASGGRKFEEET